MDTEEEPCRPAQNEANILPELQRVQDSDGKIKILVVEDERTYRALYDKGLFSELFEKKMVASGKEALLVYNEWHPDIIVLDIYLLEMTGYQVLKEIRTAFKDKATTIVMATSLSGNEDVLSCMKLGIEGYIVKPFPRLEIGPKILSYYAKKEPERAQKAEHLCREMVKQFPIKLFLDKDAIKAKEDADKVSDDVVDTEQEQYKK